MNEKLTNYVNGVFAPYDGVKSVTELKADLLADLQERFRELKAEGKDVEAIRVLLSGQPVGNDLWVALAWCVGIMLVAYLFAMRAYTKRV